MKNFLYILLFLPFLSQAQRSCGTMTHLENQMLMNPNLDQQMVQDELQLQQFISSTSMAANSIITIPVVVHVVYNNATENISDAQIYSQLDILNEDFRRLNSDTVNTPAMFQSVAADTEIEFCLAVNDPDGNPTTGITRTSTSQSSFSTNDGVKYSASGGVDAWDTDQYLNMWVCDISGGILGYAQFPGGDPTSDGVVCDYEYFGNIGTASAPYDLGRTATHEVGHWLNLRHIWGDSNCGNDFCNDTPEHSGSNYSCPTHPSPSCGNNGDMFMNYMDYTDDACMNIFTNDQKTRMIAAINTQRSGLLTSTACQSPDNGCTDPAALNYSSVAIFDDGSCCYVAGCTDPYAINYDANTCFQDNNTCIYPVLGCDNPNAANYNANANTTSCVGGVLDNNFSSGGYFYGDQHLLLDVYEACVIKSAFFEAEISNTITFELRDANGNVLDDTTHTVSPGMQQLTLNFDCPVGTDLQLGTSADNTGLFRNNTGANYPYDIGGALSITESSAGVAGYYYYYYNIEVEIGCIGVAIDSWNCINDACVDPQDGSGTYSSLADCEDVCNNNIQTIFSEDFDGGVGQFTVNTDAGSPVSWQHTTVGHVGQYQTAALLSTTAGNGWMIADSDAFGSQGGAQEYSEMVSPVIDCSMYPNVVLQFEQMFRRWQADTCIVMTSIDGGLSWTGKYYINSTVDANGTWTATIDQSGTDNPDLKQLNLSDDIGGEANVMFKFVWQGIWDYGWQIDDVALIEQPNNDLILNDFAMNMSSTVLGTADTWRDFYGHVPANQVTDAEFSFAVYNFGISDQPNVTTTVASGAWTDSENYGTLEGDSSFVVYHANQYMPTTVGQHDFTFSVSSDSTDSSPINNNGAVTVFITDTLFNGFGTGEKLGSMGTGYFTDGSDDGFKMANMYELETADELTSVTLGLRTNGSTQAGALVQVTVFDTTGFFSAGIETPIIYSNFYTITASDTTTGFATIPIPTIYNGIAQDRNLAPGAYFVSVECYNSAGTNNIVILDDKTFPRGAWSSMIYLTGDQWYTNGEALWISANFGTWDYNISGCTDSLAINFDALATIDDSSCQYCDISATIIQSDPTSSTSCDGYIFGNLSSSYSIISTQISDFNAGQVLSNTNIATGLCSGVYIFESSDIENCIYTEIISLGNVYGCTDSIMINYDQYANTDDGSCIPYIYGCTDPTQFNYDITANTDDGTCIPYIFGCADSTAYNFDSSSNTNDGSCLYCDLSVDLFTSNNSYGNCDGYVFAQFNTSNQPVAYLWSSGSTNNNIINLCSGTYTLSITDAVGCEIDTTIFIGNLGCTDPTADNYDASATQDDGSCVYAAVCSAPTGLNTYDVVHTRATFDFTSTGADYYKIRVRENGGAWQVITQLGTATGTPGGSTKTKYFLTADVSYEWQVRAWCIDGQVSGWSTSAFFNTLPECPNATNQYASDIEAEWAVLNWDAPTNTVAGVNYYLARIQEDGASAWNIVTPANGGTDNFKLKGQLIPGATYNFETRTWCNTGDANNPTDPYYKSDWGGMVHFQTIPCPVQTFNLYTSNVNATTQFFGADFVADANVPYDHFTLRFREVGATAWQFRSITAAHIAAGGRNVGGLTTGVEYEWGIRTFCGAGSTWKSPWESGPNFVAGGSSARLVAPVTALEVYPNPSRDIFNVSLTSEEAQTINVKVVNLIGEVMYSESLEDFQGYYEKGIDLSKKAKGVYFLEITAEKGVVNKKVILQ